MFWFIKNCKQAEGAFYTFAVQDDVWNKDKLDSAVSMRMTRDEACPLMYYSGFRVLDSEENYIRMPNSWEGTIDKDSVAIFTGIRDCKMVFNDVL